MESSKQHHVVKQKNRADRQKKDEFYQVPENKNSLFGIDRLVILGDSLSDRGMLWARKFLGVFPMADWSGLKGNSPDRRFTNGPVWGDYLILLMVLHFALKRMQDKGTTDPELFNRLLKKYQKFVLNPTLLDGDKQLEKFYKATMSKPTDVKLGGHDYLQSFAEGGTVARGYVFEPATTFVQFFKRLFLSNFILSKLETMRDLLFKDDYAKHRGKEEKERTYVMEWTGANDLITVNLAPTDAIAELTVAARIKNVKKLIKHGYSNISLSNLPNLARVPRFAKENNLDSPGKVENAEHRTKYFNEQLEKGVEALRRQYPHCNIDLYDVSKKFNKIYENPKKYHLDRDKLAQPLKTDKDFKAPIEGQVILPSLKHLFFDDVHPTTLGHFFLGRKSYKYLNKNYDMLDPAENNDAKVRPVVDIDDAALLKVFMVKYNYVLIKDQNGFFGGMRSSGIYAIKSAYPLRLLDIFDHALNKGGDRSKKVLRSLGWIDENGQLVADNVPALKVAYDRAVASKKQTIATERTALLAR